MDSEFIRELFGSFRPVTTKSMFGGAIYLKVDNSSIPDFEREDSKPFVYTRAKSANRIGRHSLSYWRLPDRLYDDPDELAVWAERALAIAARGKTASRAPAGGSRTARRRSTPALAGKRPSRPA